VFETIAVVAAIAKRSGHPVCVKVTTHKFLYTQTYVIICEISLNN